MRPHYLITAGMFLFAGTVSAEDVTTKPAEKHIDFMVGDQLFTRYHIGSDVAKPYFWPVNAPGGIPVTRGWPMEDAPEGGTKDHVHQKSIWFCHGDVIPHGIDPKQKIRGVEGVDYWSESKGHGVISVKPGLDGDEGGSVASVSTENEWKTADGQKILDEKRVITVRSLPSGGRLLILDIDLHASTVPITFGDTKEGSMGVRVNDQLRERGGNGQMTNASGETGAKALWGHKSDWIDYSGKVNDKPVGIAVFDDPSNPVRSAWHARDYGLLAANPFGRSGSGFPAVKDSKDLVELKKGEHLRLRYGVYVHPGDVKSGKVAEAFQTFTRKGN